MNCYKIIQTTLKQMRRLADNNTEVLLMKLFYILLLLRIRVLEFYWDM